MYVKSIKIINFRNYENQNFEFSPNINIIYGKNAQGKTNLLESIYFLSLGKSHRSISDKDLIKYVTILWSNFQIITFQDKNGF